MASTSVIASPTITAALATVSVIVPVRNRAPFLRQLLHALEAQAYHSERFEVIVVDNASTDATGAVVNEAIERRLINVRYLRKDDDGPAASRNRGAELATGDLLAFTDSDCLPAPGWLRTAALAFEDPVVAVVCGPIKPVDIGGDQPFFVHQILPVEREDGLYATANVFYRRDVFERLGGFDESARTYAWGQPLGGDDTEFAWRVKRAGYRSIFVHDACVMHQATPVSPLAYALNSVQVQVLPGLIARFPEIGAMRLRRRFFLQRQSAYFPLALVGLALARRRRSGLLLCVPWAASVWPAMSADAWPPLRWPRAALRLAFAFQSSLLLFATLLISSVRNRRLVI